MAPLRCRFSFVALALMVARFERSKRPQAAQQGFVGHPDRFNRAGVHLPVIAVQRDDIPFAQERFTQPNSSRPGVDSQVLASDQADLAQLSGHHCGVRSARAA